MPNPISLDLQTQEQPIFLSSKVSTDIIIFCTVRLDTAVDILVSVNTNLTRENSRFAKTSTASLLLNATHSYGSEFVLNSVSVEHAGLYRCHATVTAYVNPFVNGTGVNEGSINITLCKFYSNFITEININYMITY